MFGYFKNLIVFFAFSLFVFEFSNARIVGPDNFGYIAVDSNESLGVTFNWIDITATGTYWPHSDDDYRCVPIGFNFEFYGNTYSNVCIGSNGYLTFNHGYTRYTNFPFPSSIIFDPMIAPFFDDLIRQETFSGVYYQTLGAAPNRKFVVTWYIEDHFYSTPSEVTFQAILFEGNNKIKYQYLDTTFGDGDYDNGSSATVGINMGDGVNSLQYSYNEPIIQDNMAILITGTPVFGARDFGFVKVNRTRVKEYKIYNVFNVPVDINNIDVTGDAFQFSSDGENPCSNSFPFSLNPDEYCTILVAFTPEDDVVYNGSINIETSIRNVALNITGTGAYPEISIGNDFKVVNRGGSIIEIHNNGHVPLEILKLDLTNKRNFDIDLNAGNKPCGNLPTERQVGNFIDNSEKGIPADDYCTLSIKVYGTTERKQTFFDISTDDPTNPTVRILLQSSGFLTENSSTEIEQTGSSSGGCNFTGMPSIPIYLLIPVFIAIRRKFLK